VSSHKPFSEYDESVLGYQKLKKSVRGLLCREKLENGKKSTVRELGRKKSQADFTNPFGCGPAGGKVKKCPVRALH
jgi:hypothetical protein